jgi:hypothetical protein
MSNQDIQTVPLGDLRQGIEALLQKKMALITCRNSLTKRTGYLR